MRILSGQTPYDDADRSLLVRRVLPAFESVGVTLSEQLSASFKQVEEQITHLPEPYSCCMLFFTVAAPDQDACTFFVRRPTLAAAWREGTTRVRQWAWVRKLDAVELRIDWPHSIRSLEGHAYKSYRSDSPRDADWNTEGGQDSAWALTDDDFEHAELVPPIPLLNDKQPPSDHPDLQPNRRAFITPAPAIVPQTLLLHMRGIYTHTDGAQTALPRNRMPLHKSSRRTAPWLPYLATLNMLCQQQQREGNWEEATDLCDHLGMTYALLLAQSHISDSEPAHAMLMETIDRAISHIKTHMDTLLAKGGSTHIDQAICMLVFTRYLASRNSSRAFSGLIIPMERLAENLSLFKGAATPRAQQWMALALDAFEQFQADVNRAPSTAQTPYAAPSGVYPLETLLETFLKSLSTNSDSKDNCFETGVGNDRWHAIAIAESTFVNPCPDNLRDQYRHRWSADSQAFLSSTRKRIVWPEMALFLPPMLREKAAFVGLSPSWGVVNNCRTAARLLVAVFAIYKLFKL